MISKNKFALAEWIMDHVLKNGADQAAVSIVEQRRAGVKCRNKKTDQLKESVSRSLSLQIYAKQRYSGYSTNDLRKEFLSKFIREAVATTAYLAKDEYRALPDPKYYPPKNFSSETDLKLCDEDYEKIEMSRRIKTAAEIEEAALAQSDRIISVSAGYSDVCSESVRIHSNGFTGEVRSTAFSMGANVTVKDENDARPEAGFGVSSRFHSELSAAQTVGKEAVQRALRKIGQKKIASGRYDMIVENRAGARLISTLKKAMTGSALQQKSSFLEGMIGRKIASEKLTMTDVPFLEKGFGSRFFDGEGLCARERVMIEKGVLCEYYINTYYGKKLGMDPTSGSSSNTVFECGSKSPEEMIKNIKKGILVTGFIGGNSNSTSGDFSFGIVGALIENGLIVRPVNEMNVSDNARYFWARLAEVGNDPYPYSALRIPSMLFEGVNFSGF